MALIGTPQLLTTEGGVDEFFRTSYTRSFYVYATTDEDIPFILINLGFGIYSAHPDDATARCTSIKVSNPRKGFYDSVANPGGAGSPPANGTACYQWDVVSEYGPWNPIEHTEDGDPAAQPVEIKMNGVNYEQIVDIDIYGNPIVNTAGDYFDPPVTRDQTRCVLEVTRNETGFSPSTIFAYANRVNSAIWNGFPPYTVKIAPPQVVPMWSQFTSEIYSRISYTFEYDAAGWDKTLLNQGTRYLKYGGGYGGGAGTYRFNARDDKGELVTTPVLLDSLGRLLAQPINASNVVVLTYPIYQRLNFSVLGMDDIFTY
jgi:hypothetical protein